MKLKHWEAPEDFLLYSGRFEGAAAEVLRKKDDVLKGKGKDCPEYKQHKCIFWLKFNYLFFGLTRKS